MPNRPNLVFFLPDRQRFDTMSCYGNDWIHTPNLNSLASNSFVFRNAYVTQPVCSPARSSILTGLYPHSTGVTVNRKPLSSDAATIAEMVSDDYLCAYFGKWHLGDETDAQRGFDEWVSAMESMWSFSVRPDYKPRLSEYSEFLIRSGFEPDTETPWGKIFSQGYALGNRLPPEYQMSSFLAGEAEQFISRNRDRPFILFVSCLEPHPPFTGPYDHFYDPEALPVEPTFLRRPDGHSLFNRARADFFSQQRGDNAQGPGDEEERQRRYIESVGHDLGTEEGWRRLRANYFANITLVDDAMGKIMHALDDAGVADDTVLVFGSEHGDMLGTHNMLEMRTFYEEACKVPFMIRVPWLAREQRTLEGNFSQVDLVPTLLELLGEPVPEGLQGTSKAAVLRGERSLEGNNVFIEHNGVGDRDIGSRTLNLLDTLPWRSVVNGDRWKLNLCAGDQCELFDLNSDPYETTNLFNDPAYRDRIRVMAAMISEWQRNTGDKAPLPSV